jgi:hypothetical protein
MPAKIDMPPTLLAAMARIQARRRTKRYAGEVRIGHNTWIVAYPAKDGGPGAIRALAVRYHSTDIITFHPGGADGTVLTNGGWATRTTRDRLDAFLTIHGMGLTSRGGEWMVVGAYGDGRNPAILLPWRNGMTLAYWKGAASVMRASVPATKSHEPRPHVVADRGVTQ